MTIDSIPAPIRRFVLKHIHSIADIEALVMMFNDRATWSPERAATRLYVSQAEAAGVLNRLCATGLAEKRPDGYRYACQSPDTAAQAEALVALYAVQLIPVTNLIHARRAGRIGEFADAFQLRRKD